MQPAVSKGSQKSKNNDANTASNKKIDEVTIKVAEIDIKSNPKSNPPSVTAAAAVTTSKNDTAAVTAQAQTVFSYADMVLADNQQSAPKEKVKNKGKPSGNTTAPAATTAAVVGAQSNASATPVAMVEGAHIYNGKQKFSVYVHPVDGLTIDEVKTTFTRFGTVQHVSNFVIAKGTGGYAFVEFTCAEHMRAALDNKEPILIGDKIIKVEKKQVKDKSAQGKSDVSNDGGKEKSKVTMNENNDDTKAINDASTGKLKQQKNKNINETGVVKSPDNSSNGLKEPSKKGKGGGGSNGGNGKQTGGDKPKPNNEKQGIYSR